MPRKRLPTAIGAGDAPAPSSGEAVGRCFGRAGDPVIRCATDGEPARFRGLAGLPLALSIWRSRRRCAIELALDALLYAGDASNALEDGTGDDARCGEAGRGLRL